MTGDLYHCAACELVYLEQDTYGTGSPIVGPGEPARPQPKVRACPVDLSRLTLIGDADLSVFDYLAAR